MLSLKRSEFQKEAKIRFYFGCLVPFFLFAGCLIPEGLDEPKIIGYFFRLNTPGDFGLFKKTLKKHQ
ncbi:hypothetical protein RCL_jg18804.t1 [Rhizophagus clarus]|uniref:Lipoprotein n=1 Tax=Rhizophagus clarus TaxID=94130 RepID=A0A8H3R341_9GLOM|nr:hypothetical protein RCL_jg18804.t1 [Rhizophagus clarus]